MADGLLGLKMAGRKLPTGAIRTYHQVGEAMGIPWTQVQSIERRALRKIRRALEASGYGADDLHPEPGRDLPIWRIHDSGDGE